MVAFLLLGVIYIGGWGVLYYSQVFRWTWIQWPFFASLSVSAALVQLASIILGIICWRNFHRGLAQYCALSYFYSFPPFPSFFCPVLRLVWKYG